MGGWPKVFNFMMSWRFCDVTSRSVTHSSHITPIRRRILSNIISQNSYSAFPFPRFFLFYIEIPVVERYHLCYTRGILLDLLEWFFENFSFSSVDLEEDDIDAHQTIFIPFVVHIGRQITKYKRAAEEHGHTTLSTSEEVKIIKFSLRCFHLILCEMRGLKTRLPKRRKYTIMKAMN